MSKDIVMVEDEIKPLSTSERMKREKLEGQILQDFGAIFRVGQALAEISEDKLYRDTHPTFESYCKELWDIGRSRAYQIIDAAETFDNLKKQMSTTCGQNDGEILELLPVNEAQVRSLTKLRPEQQIAVWRTAIETSPQPKITASHVNKAVRNFLGEKVKTAIRTSQALVRTAPVSAEFKNAYENFSEQINKEREADYKLTSRGEIVRHLDQLRMEIAEDGDFIKEPAFFAGADDNNKLLRAGFRLFRIDKTSMTIKERSDGGWKKHIGPFETIKRMETEFNNLLQDEKHLRG